MAKESHFPIFTGSPIIISFSDNYAYSYPPNNSD